MWYLIAQAVAPSVQDMSKLSSEVQQVTNVGYTVVILQVVTIVAQVIMQRDKLRYDNRVGRLEDRQEILIRQVADCHKDRDEMKAELLEHRGRLLTLDRRREVREESDHDEVESGERRNPLFFKE